MYHCNNCKNDFYLTRTIRTSYEQQLGLLNEFDSLTACVYEACPFCLSTDFEKKGEEEMKREIIYLNETNMTFEDIDNLEDYVWKNNQLIPAEMIEGE